MANRGRLRVYLGAAPGVGKTYRMLDEGNRRLDRGTDVVAALVETRNRTLTAERIGRLSVMPPGAGGDVDVDAVLGRHPQVALIDGLERRWQQVDVLLDAGIDVISTVNIESLESLSDVVEQITGVVPDYTVPDAFVRAAEQIELVDMTPEALRRRLAHGNIFPPHMIDAALSNYFRPGNLTALRELALLWLADQVEEGLRKYRDVHGISATWETKERVVVALPGGPEGEALIRRAARIATRTTGDLLAVHIARSGGRQVASAADLDRQRTLVESLGGTYHSIVGDDVADALLDFARAKNATQIVIGASRRNPWLALLPGSGTGSTIARNSGSIDVHVVGHDAVSAGRTLPRPAGGLTVRRRVLGAVTGLVLLTAFVVAGTHLRRHVTFASESLLLLFTVVVVSLVGGFYPAVVTAIAASLLLNFYFVAPVHTFTINGAENVLALIVFVLIAGLVSRVVDQAARRSAEAARSNAEAETMAALAGSLVRGENTVIALLERVRETFAVSSVSLLRRTLDGLGRVPVAEVGERSSEGAADAGVSEVSVGDEMIMVLRGRSLAAEDQRLLAAFAAEVAVAYQQRELAEMAARAEVIAQADRARAALLNAVSHDLRTPLAAAKAAVSSLRSVDVALDADDQRYLLADADRAIDRLTALVTNLLDLSRLQAGALSVNLGAVGLDDVVSRAVASSPDDAKIDVDVPPELSAAQADAGLLERVIANLIENALRYNPSGELVRVSASEHADQLELRVVDRGPGIPHAAREQVFEAFQRRDDTAVSTGAGVGLGLAIARGFIEAMGGSIALEDTPGGGLTVVLSLEAAS